MKIVLLAVLFTFSLFKVKAQTPDDYISRHLFHSQYLMQRYGLPASIVLAIAIHESAAGKSKIARHLNNHFGIKGPNNSSEIKSAYKGYPNVDSSYSHFVDWLKSRQKMRILFEKYTHYDYKNWVYGIQRGGYAASRTWATQVLAIIKKYRLYEYDNRPADYLELPEKTEESKIEIASVKPKTYIVKTGDNLGAIAKKFKTTITNLKMLNGLKSSALRSGQKILIE